nr:hypothetical protein [Tanacetum cinerariifolium]
MLMDREAMYSCEAWEFFLDRSSAIAAHVRTLETQVAALITQTTSLQTQLTMALGRIEVLEVRDPEPRRDQLRPAAAGNHLWLSMLLCMDVDLFMPLVISHLLHISLWIVDKAPLMGKDCNNPLFQEDGKSKPGMNSSEREMER